MYFYPFVICIYMLKIDMSSIWLDRTFLNLNKSLDLGVHNPHPQCCPGSNGQTIIGIVLFSKFSFNCLSIISVWPIFPIGPRVPSKRALHVWWCQMLFVCVSICKKNQLTLQYQSLNLVCSINVAFSSVPSLLVTHKLRPPQHGLPTCLANFLSADTSELFTVSFSFNLLFCLMLYLLVWLLF